MTPDTSSPDRIMSKPRHILNTTRNCYMKRSQVLSRIGLNMAWVSEGVSVREMTLAEAISMRNEQAKKREHLASSEIPGLKWEPPTSGVAYENTRRQLLHQANEFCSQTHLPIINPTDVTLNIARHNAGRNQN